MPHSTITPDCWWLQFFLFTVQFCGTPKHPRMCQWTLGWNLACCDGNECGMLKELCRGIFIHFADVKSFIFSLKETSQ